MTDEQRLIALEKAESEYNDINSPHYRDNLRFKWAVEAINKTYKEQSNKKEE